MKRILLVALTVALALGLAATAYAGELQLGGKEAGAEVTYDNGAYANSSIWIKVGSLDFVDGTFTFHLTDLKVSYNPSAIGTGNSQVALNLDYAKWYAETGGDGIVFTLSNDRGKWVPYFGFLKPSAKVKDDDPPQDQVPGDWQGAWSPAWMSRSTYTSAYNGVKDMNGIEGLW